MHVCAHDLDSPSYCDDIVGISTDYCCANNLVFDLVLSPLFLISPTMLPSANISSHAAVVNIANAVT